MLCLTHKISDRLSRLCAPIHSIPIEAYAAVENSPTDAQNIALNCSASKYLDEFASYS
jgi:hypothetical protein